MKKIFYSMMALALTASAFTSCEDVPAPYSINYDENQNPSTPTTPTAVNTEATAFTVAQAVQKIADSNGGTTTAYVKGIVSAAPTYDASHKSITYYLSDSGTEKTLQVYSGKGLNGADLDDASIISVGDEVVVLGDLKEYTNKTGTLKVNEIDKNSKIISIKKGSTTVTPTNDANTKETAWTVAEASQKIDAATDKKLSQKAYVKGIISVAPTYNSTYKSLTYWISDNGTDKGMCIFSGKNIGGADFTSADELKVGQTVVVYGDLLFYTPKSGTGYYEMSKTNQLVEVSGTGTVTPTPTPSVKDLTVASTLVKSTDISSTDKEVLKAYKSTDGVVYTFDKGTNSTEPKFYTSGSALRLYAGNTLKIDATKKIDKIVIVTTAPATYKDKKTGVETLTPYIGSDELFVDVSGTKIAKAKDSETQISFSGINSKSVIINNLLSDIKKSSVSQLRIVSIAITYAE